MSSIRPQNKYLLLLGGNLGDVALTFDKARRRLASLGTAVRCSRLYASRPWGFEAENDFRNQVVELHSDLTPQQMLRATQRIERSLGRTAKTGGQGYESRPIDIDILFCGDEVVDEPALVIPHPQLHLRRFTLVPLCEHWAGLRHPLLHRTLRSLLDICPDHSEVTVAD